MTNAWRTTIQQQQIARQLLMGAAAASTEDKGVRERECCSDRGPVFPGGGGAPRARAVTHGHGPPFVGKQHGLHVVDVGDGEWVPVFLTCYDHSKGSSRKK